MKPAKYGAYYLIGVRKSDALRINLGYTTTLQAARVNALSLVRPTRYWSHINILDSRGKTLARVDKPDLWWRL